ncbi:copper-binding protein [Reyranella aquatilis]|uniref:Copper-binding protein n=1 Tax=Reyranella aquatilis TaxID=2035356 RepID=A0ABS8L125_9HYPH|nr:copper-binding protein [Reyranella aquatilis]MCC8431506.1 copper-binding protein [Reyranella aquatilis]
MFKTRIALSAFFAAMAVAPLATQAAGLPSPHENLQDQALEECTVEAPSDTPLASGRIVAVDKEAGRVTIDYRPLPLLPEGGVRVFAVEDPSSLKGLGPGDRVRFELERDGRGFVVTRLENSN